MMNTRIVTDQRNHQGSGARIPHHFGLGALWRSWRFSALGLGINYTRLRSLESPELVPKRSVQVRRRCSMKAWNAPGLRGPSEQSRSIPMACWHVWRQKTFI